MRTSHVWYGVALLGWLTSVDLQASPHQESIIDIDSELAITIDNAPINHGFIYAAASGRRLIDQHTQAAGVLPIEYVHGDFEINWLKAVSWNVVTGFASLALLNVCGLSGLSLIQLGKLFSLCDQPRPEQLGDALIKDHRLLFVPFVCAGLFWSHYYKRLPSLSNRAVAPWLQWFHGVSTGLEIALPLFVTYLTTYCFNYMIKDYMNSHHYEGSQYYVSYIYSTTLAISATAVVSSFIAKSTKNVLYQCYNHWARD